MMRGVLIDGAIFFSIKYYVGEIPKDDTPKGSRLRSPKTCYGAGRITCNQRTCLLGVHFLSFFGLIDTDPTVTGIVKGDGLEADIQIDTGLSIDSFPTRRANGHSVGVGGTICPVTSDFKFKTDRIFINT